MVEWRRKLKEILGDAERRDGRVRRRGGRTRKKAETDVAGNGTNGGKTADGTIVTCRADTLRKGVADGVGSDGNGGIDGANGRKNVGGAVVTGETGPLRKGVADGAGSGNVEADNSNVPGDTTRGIAIGGAEEAEGAGRPVAVEVRRVTQTALVLALEAVSEPLWALVKSVGTGGGELSA